MILEKVKPCLDKDVWESLQGCLEFLRAKAAKAEKRILKAIGGPEEALIRTITEQDHMQIRFLKVLWALAGKWDDLFRMIYYYSYAEYFDIHCVRYLSAENYARYKENQLARAEKLLEEKDYRLAYYSFSAVHELEPIIRHCVKPLLDDGESELYVFDPKRPIDVHAAHHAAEFCVELGLSDRARYCIDTLRNYQKMPYRTRAGTAFRPEVYAPAVDFLDHVLLARLATDPEEARRHAAQAMEAWLRNVVRNYKNEDASDFGCDFPGQALYPLVEFDFDPEWARNYLRNDCVMGTSYHQVFFKMVQLGAWARHPDELGLWPPAQAGELIKQIKKELREQGK